MIRYLLTEDVAARYGMSRRWVHERTRLGELPHRVLPRGRRVLFSESELEAYEAGCELERVDLPNGGRIIRPRGATS